MLDRQAIASGGTEGGPLDDDVRNLQGCDFFQKLVGLRQVLHHVREQEQVWLLFGQTIGDCRIKMKLPTRKILPTAGQLCRLVHHAPMEIVQDRQKLSRLEISASERSAEVEYTQTAVVSHGRPQQPSEEREFQLHRSKRN